MEEQKDNAALTIAEGIARAFAPVGSPDEAKLRMVTEFSFQLRADQTQVMMMLLILQKETRIPETEREKLNIITEMYSKFKRHDQTQRFLIDYFRANAAFELLMKEKVQAQNMNISNR